MDGVECILIDKSNLSTKNLPSQNGTFALNVIKLISKETDIEKPAGQHLIGGGYASGDIISN